MKKLVIFLTLLLFSCDVAKATFISLTTTMSEIEILEEAKSSINITNFGDEPAFSLTISLILPEGFETDKISLPKLNPNSSFEGTFNIKRKKEVNAGKYPVIVFLEYADANGYPFSAISSTFLIHKTNTFSKIFASLSEVVLKGKEAKKISLKLRNLDDVEHEVKVKIFVPSELKVEGREKILVLNSKEEKELSFTISNFAALEGSTYTILASIEYEAQNLHYSSSAFGVVKIVSEKFDLLNILYFLLAVLLTIEVFLFLKRKLRKKS